MRQAPRAEPIQGQTGQAPGRSQGCLVEHWQHRELSEKSHFSKEMLNGDTIQHLHSLHAVWLKSLSRV